MPDICMCRGETPTRVCPMRDGCYRYTADPDWRYQSFFSPMPLRLNESCDYYIPYLRKGSRK